ncbi:MAG: GNAT family N-acetyltransferase [Lachnospiraceae bacterium]|nr:GNAT family N-acetyltransferase [Lachnospiraceae bacterium]
MEITYKKLTEKELDTVIKMRLDQLTEEYVSDGRTVPEGVDLEAALYGFYRRNMAAGTYVSWLAFDGERIIGTSGMSFAEKPPYFTCPTGRLGILSSMYTDPEYRRMGIATNLLDRVVKEAKDYGCGTIYITASDAGVKLYESYGFKHNGNFMQYYF